jgi:hypothetical protein
VTDDAKNVTVTFRAPVGMQASRVTANAGDLDLQLAVHPAESGTK